MRFEFELTSNLLGILFLPFFSVFFFAKREDAAFTLTLSASGLGQTKHADRQTENWTDKQTRYKYMEKMFCVEYIIDILEYIETQVTGNIQI